MLSHSDIIDDEIKSLLATLPGFRDYQERLPEPDLESLLTKYEQSLRQSDKLTYGIRTNIKLIKRKYNEQKSKASESSPEKKDENGEFGDGMLFHKGQNVTPNGLVRDYRYEFDSKYNEVGITKTFYGKDD